MKLTWRFWYGARSYARSSLWIIPLIAVVLYLLMTRLVHGVGVWIHQAGIMNLTTGVMGLHMAGARTLLETIITMTLSFLVFTFGSLLVAIQVASGQYTPRIIATTLLRDNVIRGTAGLFIFTFLFALRTLDRMNEVVHQLSTMVAGVFGLICIVAFLYLIDYAAKMLRPVSIVARVAEDGLAVIEAVYPVVTDEDALPPIRQALGPAGRIVDHEGRSGTVLAIDVDDLVAHANAAHGVIEIIPCVGDFLAVGEPLFRMYGGAVAIDDEKLRSAVALGSERTMEQDPIFAFRILVDIALKALSKAINDPTTAVLAIDQIHRLLRRVGWRYLRDDEIRDRNGEVRLILPTPNWEDYVHIAFREIRHYGGGSMQIARRLRAMVENLLRTLPPHRHAALLEELALLDRGLDRLWPDPEDRALAAMADGQGLGGAARA